MTTSAVVVGRGPAGLLSAELLREAGIQVSIVAESEGSLAMWPGDFSFGRKPLSYLNFPIQMSADKWRERFSWFGSIMDGMGIPMGMTADGTIPNTVTAIGFLRPTYCYPIWMYASIEPEDVIFVGIEGLADSVSEAQAANYSRLTGMTAYGAMLPRPPGWTSEWGPLRFAGFLDLDTGEQWLTGSLDLALKGIPKGIPVLLPQVVGLENTGQILFRLSSLFSRKVVEYPLVSPSVSGIRVRDRWIDRLRRDGVMFISGRVAKVTPDARIEFFDGRYMQSDIVVLATGGVLGGGIEIDLEGEAVDVITSRQVGLVHCLDDLDHVGHESLYPVGGERVMTVGRQLRGWEPEKNHSGGAMLLATVSEGLGPYIGGKFETD